MYVCVFLLVYMLAYVYTRMYFFPFYVFVLSLHKGALSQWQVYFNTSPFYETTHSLYTPLSIMIIFVWSSLSSVVERSGNCLEVNCVDWSSQHGDPLSGVCASNPSQSFVVDPNELRRASNERTCHEIIRLHSSVQDYFGYALSGRQIEHTIFRFCCHKHGKWCSLM